MRIGIEKLAWLLSAEPGDATLGELAQRHGVTTERIIDAMDVLKIRRGSPTQLPAVRWDETPPTAHLEPSKPPQRIPCSDGFHWLGQPFWSCDACGQPAWEHAGMAALPEGASPFGSEPFALRPWAPGEAEAIEGKWRQDYESHLRAKARM